MGWNFLLAFREKGHNNLNNISEIMPVISQFMTLIEKQFGNKCEIILSTFEDGRMCIADIRNGHITGRNVGDNGCNTGLEVTPGTVVNGNRFNYITTIRDGKILRSSTIYIHDSDGNITAAVSVNLDITDTMRLEGFLRQYNQFEQNSNTQDDIAASDVNSLLDQLIEKGQQKIGKSAEEMSKSEKVEFIHYLDDKGAFLITKSGERVCELLEISKFTFYSYLEKSRNIGNSDGE